MARGAVLLVDDDPQILRFVGIFLEQAGFEVVAAAGGREAVLRAQERDFDAVVLDQKLPDLSGVEALVEIRKARPAIAAIFSSGRVSPELSATAQQLHALILEKPYRSAVLVEALDRLLHARA